MINYYSFNKLQNLKNKIKQTTGCATKHNSVHRQQSVYNIVGLNGNGEAKGPNSKAQRAKTGRVLGERMFPHQLRGLRECCKLPQWGPGQSPGDLAI